MRESDGKKKKLYSFDDHPDHKALAAGWGQEHGVKVAMHCGQMTQADRLDCAEQVRGLYAAVNRKPPKRMVFVASKLGGSFAVILAVGVDAVAKKRRLSHADTSRLLSGCAELYTRRGWRVISGEDTPPDSLVTGAIHQSHAILGLDVSPGSGSATDRDLAEVVNAGRATAAAAYNGGNQWSGGVSYLSFFRHVAKLDIDYSKWQYYEGAARYGPRWTFEDVCVVSDWPEYIRTDDQNRPHSATGPYIRWRDGWGLWYWHGTAVRRQWIEDPASVDPSLALTLESAEERRCVAEIIGWQKVLERIPTRTVDDHPDPVIGTLIEADLPEGSGRFLRVRCGTGRTFVLRCRDDVETALQAQAEIWQIDQSMLKQYGVRT